MEIAILIAVSLSAIFSLLAFLKKHRIDNTRSEELLRQELERIDKSFKEENSNLRKELNQLFKDNREELNKGQEQIRNTIDSKFLDFSKTLNDLSKELSEKQDKFRQETEDRLNNTQTALNKSFDNLRDTLQLKFKEFSDTQNKNDETIINKQNEIRLETEKKLLDSSKQLTDSLENLSLKLKNSLSEFNDTQKKISEEYLNKHNEIKNTTETKLEEMRKTVEERLSVLQTENSKKLDEMRNTVDQKLHETLEKKLSESFNNVSKQLQDVHQGLGEMKNLANDVGGLKKVLTNVKTRGIIGEIQLGNILESILNREQYDSNVATKKNTQQRVEYAIKLPGKDDDNSIVYLPIDSKFPDSAYQNLLNAYDSADVKLISDAKKELEKIIKTFAKDIHDKYINPPDTTDFAIMFLPFEGLYAEVLQNPNLVIQLQEDYRINIAGPTTLGAFINSLQMGFKTLAIEKRSSEVWKLLGSVKFEFNKFGDVLEQTQKKLRGATDDLDKLVGTRTKKIQSALKKVEILSNTDTQYLNDMDDESEN